LLLAACSRDPDLPAVRYDATDSAILVAALMPACGCLSLANIRDEAGGLEPDGSGGIEVVASLEGKETGTIVLGSRQEHTEKFDWAGSLNSDRYQIVAYARRPDGSRGERLRQISRNVRFSQRALVSHPCQEPVCAFGPLALSSVVNERGQRSR
jgi:hypothetical protein